MALSQQLVGPQAEAAVFPRRKPGCFHRLRGEFRMGRQEGRYRPFIFLRGEGAGGIHQPPAGAHQPGRGMEDLSLPPGAHLHRLLAPVCDGGFLLAEHALAGAGGVHQHPVEKAGETLGQGFRVLVGHQSIAHRHPLDVPGQNLCPLGVDFIAQKKSFARHPSGNLGALASGGGTEVADPFAGLGIQQSHRRHGTGLL